jgi:DHA1 family bicyclomycin/chloramphenicol resistance-like MFS transporter
MAAGQMFWGLLSDRFGRRPMLLAGLALYGLGALGSGLADSMNMLLFARVVWGLGAAAPSVLRNSIARDLYSGDHLARITSLTMAIFLIGPAVAPSFGELILLGGSWRYVFFSAAPLAALGIWWSLRFGETLPPEHRRPLERRTIGIGVRTFFGNRATLGFTLSTMFASGAFYIFLGSGQPIIDDIYGYGDWFALLFAGVAATIGCTVLASSRFISRYGARNVSAIAAAIMVASAAVFLVVSMATDGTPPFWFWFAAVTAFGSFTTVTTPSFVALALTPMARVAGIASGINGLLAIGGGSLLAALFDRRIETSVTPMAVGFLLYSLLAFAAMVWARGGSLEIVEPEERLKRLPDFGLPWPP